MKKKLALNFKETRDQDLSLLALSIVDKMTNNEHFPGSGHMVTELKQVQDQFRNALVHARSRDVEKVSHKKDIRLIMIKKMKELGEYVLTAAKNEETPLISSGFPLAKHAGETTIHRPDGFKIMTGANEGEIIMQARRVPGAKSYIYQYTREPLTKESVWETIVDTRCKKIITNLPPGVKFVFRMAAVGPKNQVAFTEALRRYVV